MEALFFYRRLVQYYRQLSHNIQTDLIEAQSLFKTQIDVEKAIKKSLIERENALLLVQEKRFKRQSLTEEIMVYTETLELELFEKRYQETSLREILSRGSSYNSQHSGELLKLKGALIFPVLDNHLKDKKNIQPRSDGIVYPVLPNSKVYAVHQGRITFANWLRGLGMLVVIDHGDNHTTLYGLNEAVFVDVGDQVLAGDLIALSESNVQSQLYFGIRQGLEVIEPLDWFRW